MGGILAALSLMGACGRPRIATVATPTPAGDHPTPPAAPPAPETPFAAWLRAHVPTSARVASSGGVTTVEHVATADDTALTIANAYLDVTDIYRAKDLAAEIAKRHPTIAVGDRIEIPHLLPAPYSSPEEGRLPWPDDRALRGVFISGVFAGAFWPETVDKLASHGLNAVVLDAKDYMGTVNYPTRVTLAKRWARPTRHRSPTTRVPFASRTRAAFASSRESRVFMIRGRPSTRPGSR
jgi:hypothetical protein